MTNEVTGRGASGGAKAVSGLVVAYGFFMALGHLYLLFAGAPIGWSLFHFLGAMGNLMVAGLMSMWLYDQSVRDAEDRHGV